MDFLTRLAEMALAPTPAVKPVLPSMFEPAPGEPAKGLEEDVEMQPPPEPGPRREEQQSPGVPHPETPRAPAASAPPIVPAQPARQDAGVPVAPPERRARAPVKRPELQARTVPHRSARANETAAPDVRQETATTPVVEAKPTTPPEDAVKPDSRSHRLPDEPGKSAPRRLPPSPARPAGPADADAPVLGLPPPPPSVVRPPTSRPSPNPPPPLAGSHLPSASEPRLSQAAAPSIQVRIGRVEVRAAMVLPPVPTGRRGPAPPKLSLEEYLRSPRGGRR